MSYHNRHITYVLTIESKAVSRQLPRKIISLFKIFNLHIYSSLKNLIAVNFFEIQYLIIEDSTKIISNNTISDITYGNLGVAIDVVDSIPTCQIHNSV